MLLVLSQTNNDWEDPSLDFHFFIVDNIVIWRNVQEIITVAGDYSVGFNYNQVAQMGVVYSIASSIYPKQDIMYFSLSEANSSVTVNNIH